MSEQDVTARTGAVVTVTGMENTSNLPATLGPSPEPDSDTGKDIAAMQAAVAAGLAKDAVKALPAKLSPSRASDFKKCPQLFFFKTICGITTPSSEAALRGTLAHACFERIFDHPAGERDAETALRYLRPAWEEIVNPDLDSLTGVDRERAEQKAIQAREAVPPGTDAETALLAAAEAAVRSWFDMERVNNFTPRDLELPSGKVIDGRELYVIAKLTGVKVHGFIDRLDRYQTSSGEVCWSISDYKTSAVAPWLKKPYPEHTKKKIRDDAFFQLKVYAVLAWKMFGIKVGLLRLVYVATGDRVDGIGTEVVTQKMIDDTIRELEGLWREINTAARTGVWKTQTGPLCNYCYFQDICPAWAPEISSIVSEANQKSA